MALDIPGDAIRVLIIGIGATAAMDAWLLLLKRLKVPTLNFALVGRWAGHVARGRWAHDAIAKAAPVDDLHEEMAYDEAFAQRVAAPLREAEQLSGDFGARVMDAVRVEARVRRSVASRTPTPLKNCLRSLISHAVFGIGLYLAAALTAAVWR